MAKVHSLNVDAQARAGAAHAALLLSSEPLALRPTLTVTTWRIPSSFVINVTTSFVVNVNVLLSCRG